MAIPRTILTAKGDIIGATAAETPARLGVGANDTVLTADSAQSTGIKWAEAGGEMFPVMLTPWSRESLGVQIAALAMAAPTSAIWPAANQAVYVPFVVDKTATIVKGFWYNGAAVSGNVDLAVYNESYARQVSIGSTAQSGTNTIQEVNIADTSLAPGRYYLALACDNTTAEFFRVAFSSVHLAKTLAFSEQASAFALPSTATPVVPTYALLPMFGVSLRTLVA